MLETLRDPTLLSVVPKFKSSHVSLGHWYGDCGLDDFSAAFPVDLAGGTDRLVIIYIILVVEYFEQWLGEAAIFIGGAAHS
jgi:hypothetical protein